MYLIAEAGLNHCGNLNDAKRMIEEAKRVGAQAIKFQAYTARDRFRTDVETAKAVSSMELDVSEFNQLRSHAKKIGIDIGMTFFSPEWIGKFEEADITLDFIKIASCDVGNLRLHEAIKRSDLSDSVIASTGTADMNDIMRLKGFYTDSSKKLTLLHCVSSYPCPATEANLLCIKTLENLSDIHAVGYSDHSRDKRVVCTSVALGAKVIEVHFTLDHKRSDIDDIVSYDPEELSTLVSDIQMTKMMLGNSNIKALAIEKEELLYRTNERNS